MRKSHAGRGVVGLCSCRRGVLLLLLLLSVFDRAGLGAVSGEGPGSVAAPSRGASALLVPVCRLWGSGAEGRGCSVLGGVVVSVGGLGCLSGRFPWWRGGLRAVWGCSGRGFPEHWPGRGEGFFLRPGTVGQVSPRRAGAALRGGHSPLLLPVRGWFALPAVALTPVPVQRAGPGRARAAPRGCEAGRVMRFPHVG